MKLAQKEQKKTVLVLGFDLKIRIRNTGKIEVNGKELPNDKDGEFEGVKYSYIEHMVVIRDEETSFEYEPGEYFEVSNDVVYFLYTNVDSDNGEVVYKRDNINRELILNIPPYSTFVLGDRISLIDERVGAALASFGDYNDLISVREPKSKFHCTIKGNRNTFIKSDGCQASFDIRGDQNQVLEKTKQA